MNALGCPHLRKQLMDLSSLGTAAHGRRAENMPYLQMLCTSRSEQASDSHSTVCRSQPYGGTTGRTSQHAGKGNKTWMARVLREQTGTNLPGDSHSMIWHPQPYGATPSSRFFRPHLLCVVLDGGRGPPGAVAAPLVD